MTAEDLVTIAKYSDEFEASMAGSMLVSYGIHGLVVGGEINNVLWHLGPTIAGVALQVDSGEADEASEILEQFLRTTASADSTIWICSKCGEEVQGDFVVCWSCGASIDATPHELMVSTSDVIIDAEELLSHNSLIADEKGRRALRAVLIGIFFLPPVLLYAFYLLAELSEQEFSRRAAWQFRWAVFFVMVMMVYWLGLFWWLVSR